MHKEAILKAQSAFSGGGEEVAEGEDDDGEDIQRGIQESYVFTKRLADPAVWELPTVKAARTSA